MENLELNIKELKSFYKNKKVLITGHTGFKGSWLSLWLKEMGADVIGYALPPVSKHDHFCTIGLENHITHVIGDLMDRELLTKTFEEHQPEIVFHLAAQALVRLSYEEPHLTFQTNVLGSVNLLEAVKSCPTVKSVIYVTSDKAYKNKEWIWGYRENDELGGHDPYSASKAAAELVFSSYFDSFFSKSEAIGLASVRAGNVIGGGGWAKDRIVPDCIKSLSNDLAIEIRNPHATRPWQHVLEPLSGYLLLGYKLFLQPKKYSGSWNFGPTSNSITTVKELVDEIISSYGKGELNVNIDPNAVHEASILHLNCDKSNTQLGWYPKWDFTKTIINTVNWYIGLLEGKDAYQLTKNDIIEYINTRK